MYLKRAIFLATLYALLLQHNRIHTITTCSPARVAILVPSKLRENASAIQQGKELELLWIFLDKQNTSILTVIDHLSKTFNTSKGIAALVGSGFSFIDGLAAELANHFAVPFIGLKSPSQGDNVISLLPSQDSRLGAFISIAVELACVRITVFTSHLDNQILFSDLAHRAQKIALVLTIVTLKQSESQWTKALQVSKEIVVLNKSSTCMVVMDTNPTDTEIISKAMSSLGVLSKQFVWIAFDSLSNSDANAFIENTIAMNWPFTHMELMTDAISLVKKALDQAPLFKKRLSLMDNDTDIETRRTLGRDIYRMLTLQKLQGATGKIAFNSQGKRVFYKYDIAQLNKDQQKRHWTTVGAVDNNNTTFYYNFWQKETHKPSSIVLRMVTIEEDPVTIVSKEKLKPGEECILSHPCYKYKKTRNVSGIRQVERYCCSGFMFDILELLQQDLNFQPDIYFVEDERYGAYNTKTHTWNGMINDILQGKADMTLSMLTINEIRSRVIDYSPALLHSETKIMISVAKTETTFWDFAFFYPFSTNLWIVGVAVVNFMLVIIWSFDRLSPYGHYKHNYGNSRLVFNLPACMSYVWGLVFKLQLDNVTPRATSTRFTSVIFAFFTLVLISTYTANLAAYLVKAREDYPISDIRNKQFTDRSLGFKFATLESSSIEMLFSRSHDPTFRRIYQNMKPYQVGTYREAIAKLRSRQLDAFIDDSPYLDLAASKQADCSFRIIGRPIKMNTLGIVFRRGSKWIEPITNLLLKYQRKDHFRKLRQKWFSGVCANAETTNKANELAAKHFGGLFLVCSAAIVICVMLLIIELVWYRFLKRFLTSYNVKQIENSNLNHEIALSRTNIRELLPMSTLEMNGGCDPDSNKMICTELGSSFTNISTLS